MKHLEIESRIDRQEQELEFLLMQQEERYAREKQSPLKRAWSRITGAGRKRGKDNK